MHKSLDKKLKELSESPESDVFILADAKDPDMGFGIQATGPDRESKHKWRSLQQFHQIIRELVDQQLVDIMLMSAATSYELTIQERVFDNSTVTPAVRANDSTDIFGPRGGDYSSHASLQFQSTTIDHIQSGHVDCPPEERSLGVDLALFSVTFNNNPMHDRATLQHYRDFRIEAERRELRHFLEVFDPNIANAVNQDTVAEYVNDMIVRMLAGVPQPGRPVFLKMAYHGPAALEELYHYDPRLIVGILGGSAGTTYDAFKLLSEAKKYGAKVALFGRKINGSEDQLEFVRHLRLIADNKISPEEAVKSYHGSLQSQGILPMRPLDDDLTLQTHLRDLV